jgi:hypothetical protein
MSFRPDHELHKRRFGRNLGLAVVLALFVALMFGLTVVKVSNVGPIEGYDHVMQPQLIPQEEGQ